MQKRTLRRFLAVALLIMYICPLKTLAEAAPRYRALLIACDTFPSTGNMAPIGQNNLSMMEIILEKDTRGYEVTAKYESIVSLGTLEAAIQEVFGGATENDVSLLYFYTHGLFDSTFNNPEGQLLFSDGEVEEAVSAQQLDAILEPISGTKVLLVDACNSGALIGKGVSPSVGSARVARAFETDDYRVLTSSGASEPSWYWFASIDTVPPGSSYFTTALAMGAGLLGIYPADTNHNGVITMAEMYLYLWNNQASSVAQMFPQENDFPLFVYDRPLSGDNELGALTLFTFQNIVLDAGHPVLTMAYTVTQPTHVSYRVTWLRDGIWDWASAVTLPHETLFPHETNQYGAIQPGRKTVSLNLGDILPEDWTYAMIHIMTVADGSTSSDPFIYAARVLSARQTEGDPALSLRIPSTWNRSFKRELEVFIGHALPVSLSVTIENEVGKVVKRLAVSQRTHPQALKPDGSLLYWNGLDESGQPVPPGRYLVKASGRPGARIYTAEAMLTIQ
ncbi:MAG: caspase family protein [Firmicutes bacterium]|nr:caspase family protein [Bacillota bacterium]